MNQSTKFVLTTLVLLTALFASGCQANNPTEEPAMEAETTTEEVQSPTEVTPTVEEKTLYIGPEKVECVGVAPMECYQVKENLDDEWQLFYDEIEGFTWEPGYTYELRVAVHPVENPPADGSSLRYELIEVVDKVETPVEAPQYITIEQPAEGAMLDASQPILVSGMGAGLFEGNVVVQILDADGNELALQPTTIQSPEAGMGGEGPWEVELTIAVEADTAGKIVAFSNSPADGSVVAQDEIAVTFQPQQNAAVSLENTTWQLVSLADGSLNAPLAIHAVTATFFPEDARIAGGAGCNRYFGNYKLDGNQLQIPGPLGTTMMMCPEPQMTIESTYLSTLGQVNRYEIDANDQLNLFDSDGNNILVFQVDPYSTTVSFTREELANAAYLNEFASDGKAQLEKGAYREPVMEGSATELTVSLTNFAAFGDLDGNGSEEAAVILVSDPGGSGTFYDLAVVSKNGETLENVAAIRLGDRVQIQSIHIENGDIAVTMLTHGADDPMCCPSLFTINHYALQNGQLVLTKTEATE